MPDKKRFDPRKFIDREFEQEMFEDLLQFDSDARILAIEDKGGMGKSQLLEKFQYRCRTIRPRTPVSLIALDQLPDNNPMTLIETMEQDLSAFGLKFPAFNRYDIARASGDFETIQTSIYLEGAVFQGASDVRIAARMTNISGDVKKFVVESTGERKLTPEQQMIADDVCVRAFLDDLHGITAEQPEAPSQPAVLILDAFEKCASELRQWIENFVLERYFFDPERRKANLVLVMAGREITDFEMQWPVEDYERVVVSINQLGKWTKEHVEECLRAHGFNYEPQDVDTFYRLIERGLPPSEVIRLMGTLLTTKQEQS